MASDDLSTSFTPNTSIARDNIEVKQLPHSKSYMISVNVNHLEECERHAVRDLLEDKGLVPALLYQHAYWSKDNPDKKAMIWKIDIQRPRDLEEAKEDVAMLIKYISDGLFTLAIVDAAETNPGHKKEHIRAKSDPLMKVIVIPLDTIPLFQREAFRHSAARYLKGFVHETHLQDETLTLAVDLDRITGVAYETRLNEAIQKGIISGDETSPSSEKRSFQEENVDESDPLMHIICQRTELHEELEQKREELKKRWKRERRRITAKQKRGLLNLRTNRRLKALEEKYTLENSNLEEEYLLKDKELSQRYENIIAHNKQTAETAEPSRSEEYEQATTLLQNWLEHQYGEMVSVKNIQDKVMKIVLDNEEETEKLSSLLSCHHIYGASVVQGMDWRNGTGKKQTFITIDLSKNSPELFLKCIEILTSDDTPESASDTPSIPLIDQTQSSTGRTAYH